MQSTQGRAILLLMAEGVPQHIAEATVEGTDDWLGGHSVPEIDHLRCPWCGKFHEDPEHIHKACQFITGKLIFGPEYFLGFFG